MDSEQKHTTYSSMTVPRKSKVTGKKPPAPPPRKSSAPGASQGQNPSAQKPPVVISSQAKGDMKTSLPPLPAPPLPPYNVLVPSLPTPANSSAFPSREPTPRLPRSQSTDQMNHGMQFDIHGDVIVEQMLPVRVTAPQPPPSTVNHERDSDLTPKKTSASLTLKELADYHFPKFPLQVQILEGYMSSYVPHLTLSTADIYNIHLLKRQEVIVAKDSLGHQYNIPLNTAIHFGLLPSNEVLQAYYGKSDQESNTDLSFTKVSDILAMKVLPKVVCATKASKNEGDKGSVEAGEILAIEKVSKLKKKKVLEVHSISKKAQKVLSHDCSGHFTTSPRQVAMQLPDLIEHIPDVLPCQVFLFFNEDRTSEKLSFLSTSLSNGVVTLTKRIVEISLVASSVLEDAEMDLNSDESLLDIPLDENLSQIEVAIVKSADIYSRKRLRTATQNILKNVNLSKLRSYRDAASDNVYEAQTMLYSAHNVENERLGVEFEAPLGINQESTSSQSVSVEPEAYDTVPQRNKDLEGEQTYETIADIAASTKKYSESVQNKTDYDRSSASVAALDDDVFMSEKRPLSSTVSNLDSHPRAQIIRQGFYQSPRLQPGGYVPDNYDFLPARRVIAKPKNSKSLSAGDGRLSSSSLSINHPPVTAQKKLSLDTASVSLRQNRTDRISGSLDDILAYEDMQSVRSSYVSQSALMGDSQYEVFNPPPASHQKMAALDDKLRLLQKENEMLSEKVASLEQSKLSMSLQNAVDRIEDLESKLKLCMERLQGSDGPVEEKERSKTAETVNKQHNRELLQRATTDQILHVLDSMGLHQYKEIFLQERIDGAVLLELDAEVLRYELGVKSKIHCVKLTKLISGDHSIRQFLQNPLD